MASRYPFVGAAAHLFPKNAIKMLSFSTSGKGSILLLSVQILYEKTEEAKRLLRYSDKPITAISSYLGFSSPSHFSRVFKARVCITPGEYREKHP